LSSVFPLVPLVQLVLETAGKTEWLVRDSETWCQVEPAGAGFPLQGWKVHVAATPLAAPVVLYRCAEVLIRHGCAFKFARSLDRVEALVSTRHPRDAAGKFLTAYPSAGADFPALLDDLDRATAGLPGPQILSDRRYRPNSLVHYRFGAITGLRVLTDDGSYQRMLRAPDGTLVADQRHAWFSPPSWAGSPFPDTPPPPAPARAPAILLADRFEVRTAIQHANKGGVFRALDRATGAEVVIKQARPHVGATLAGTDVRDSLRNEADMLDLLAPTGIAPRRVLVFEHGGSLFLAEESIDGTTLRAWVSQRVAGTAGLARDAVLDLAIRLTELVMLVHERGLVLRDFNPNNVLVTPAGELRLIDLECVTRPGTPVPHAHTPGYAAPEQRGGPAWGPAPEPSADLFSLGATLFHLLAGQDPLLLDDHGSDRSTQRRIAGRLTAMATDLPATATLAPVITGLMNDEPTARWDIDRVRLFLVAPAPEAMAAPAEPDLDRLITDGLDHVLDTMDPASTGWLWKPGTAGADTDPCAVQNGAAGVLAMLVQAAAQRPDPRLRTAVRTVGDWIVRRLPAERRVLPGLYFGRSGTAWALHDAGRLLDDEGLIGVASGLARRLPTSWPCPEICHGLAGAGLALLHLWQTGGDPDLAERVRECADRVVAAATPDPAGVFWPIPAEFDRKRGGARYFGFGHGLAGIGAFLLAAGQTLEVGRYLELADAAGATLARAVVMDGDAARWPLETGRPEQTPLSWHWCSGASGIATFLLQLHLTTGEQRYRELAEAAALTVHRNRWRALPGSCHGLAGDGQLLLDLSDALGEPHYLTMAADLARCISTQHTIRAGRMLLSDESLREVTVGYQTGLAGALSYLIRLRHGGIRPWLPKLPAGSPAGTQPLTRR